MITAVIPRIEFKPCLRGPKDQIGWTEDQSGKRWIRCRCGLSSPVRLQPNGIAAHNCGCGFAFQGELKKWD